MTDRIAETVKTDLTAQLAGRALVLNLLGRLLYQAPEADWLQGLADECVFDDIPFAAQRPDVAAGLALLQKWSRHNRGGQLAQHMDILTADYNRLFVGPGKIVAPPWESAQVDDERQLFQEETLAVRNWYRRFGLQAERLYAEPDDHVGLELAFLAHLAQLALAAQAAADPARLSELLAAERAFLTEHALRWIPAWAAQVVEQARTCFYRGLAQVTAGVLAEMAALPAAPEAEAA
jgi:TorA maturation chaperone TorD